MKPAAAWLAGLLLILGTTPAPAQYIEPELPLAPELEAHFATQLRSGDAIQDLVVLGPTRPVLVRLHISVDSRPFKQSYREFIKYLFNYLDTNKNGVLDGKEIASVPPPATLFGANPFAFAFGDGIERSKPDLNGDGKVTEEELGLFYRRASDVPFQLQADQNFRYYRPREGLNNSLGAEELNRLLFQHLDQNKDGKLSREELKNAEQVLRKADLNEDELVTPGELNGEMPSDDPYGLIALGQRPLPQETPFLVVKDDPTQKAIVQRLLSQYGTRVNGKTATRLSRAEIGLSEADFKALDKNGDGWLDASELAAFVKRAPDAELGVSVSEQSFAVVAHQNNTRAPLGKNVKAEGQAVRLTVDNLEVAFSVSNAQSMSIFGDLTEFYKMRFTEMDTDGNGYLEDKEVQNDPFFSTAFALMDRDNDGKVYMKELTEYLTVMKDLQAKARIACLTLSIADDGRGLFAMLDSNNDGKLSIREIRGAVKLLDELDRQRTGVLASSMIPRKFTASMQKGAVTNFGGGFALETTSSSASAKPKEPAPAWFLKMDRNGDLDVSRKEFLGTEEMFRKIDSDGDGLISLEEAKAFDARLRPPQKPAEPSLLSPFRDQGKPY